MRKLTYILIFILTGTTAFCQNPYAQKFGSSPAEVEEFLETRSSLTIKVSTPVVILAETPDMSLEYKFSNGKLSETKMTKHFEDKKNAKNTLDSFLDFFKRMQADVNTDEKDKNHGTHYAQVDANNYTVSHNFNKEKSTIVFATVNNWYSSGSSSASSDDTDLSE